MKIVLVLGAVGVGKSTYCDSFSVEDYVVFRPGRIIRMTAGVGFMKGSKNPNAPLESELLVRGLFCTMLDFSARLGRTLVCDGFPRNVSQVLFMESQIAKMIPACGHVHLEVDVLQASPEEQEKRIENRKQDLEFDRARVNESQTSLSGIIEALSKLERDLVSVCFREIKI